MVIKLNLLMVLFFRIFQLIYQESKNINIRIEDLKISADENSAMVEFTQSYSSSILKDKGKKTLELKKINDEWKIYSEIM